MCHLFFDCDFAKTCWQLTGMSNDMSEVEYVSDWLLSKLSTKSGENLIKISTVLYAVWFARNQEIFEGKALTPELAMQWSSKQIVDWQTAQRRRGLNDRTEVPNQTQNCTRWCPPGAGELKVNVDGSVYAGQDCFSIGMVMRNHLGHYVKGKTMRFAESVPVMEAELIGIAEALKWIVEVPSTMQVTLESDSLLSINAIKNSTSNLLEMGNVISFCREFLYSKLLSEKIKSHA